MSKIHRLHSVMAETGLGHSAIYAKIAKGEFPKPIKLGLRSVGWLDDELQSWIKQRISERDQSGKAA